MQLQTREETCNIALEYCSLLIELGIPQILSIEKEIHRATPEVEKFFFALGNHHIRRKLKTVYGIRVVKEKGGGHNGEIRFLNRFLQALDLRATVAKRASGAVRGGILKEYKIVSKTTEHVEDIRETISTGDKDKILALFIKRYNPKNVAFGKKPGVYKILCVPTGDSYIGSSTHVPNRLQTHKAILNSKKLSHHSHKLQELWDTHGKHNFEFSVLEYTTKHQRREKDFIKEQKPSLNTRLLPIEQPSTRIKVLPEIKERLVSLSNTLDIDMNRLVNNLLMKELKALTK